MTSIACGLKSTVIYRCPKWYALALSLVSALTFASTSDAQPGTIFGVSNNIVSGGTTATLVSINPQTGVGTEIGEIGFGNVVGDTVSGLAYDSTTQTLYGSFLGDLVVINPRTAAVTTVGSLDRAVLDLTFDQTTNTLLGIGQITNAGSSDTELFSIDTNTGQTTQLAILGPVLFGVSADEDGDLFGLQVDIFNPANPLVSIDTPNASTSIIGAPGTVVATRTLTFDPFAGAFYSTNPFEPDGQEQLIAYDASTGEANIVGTIGIGDVDRLVFAPDFAVPEPSSICLTVSMCAPWLARRRRSH